MDIDPKISELFKKDKNKFKIDNLIIDEYYKQVSNIILGTWEDPDGIRCFINFMDYICSLNVNKYASYCVLRKYDELISKDFTYLVGQTVAFYVPENIEILPMHIIGSPTYIKYITFDISLEQVLLDSKKMPNLNMPSYHKYGTKNINIKGQIFKRIVPNMFFMDVVLDSNLTKNIEIYIELVKPIDTIAYNQLAKGEYKIIKFNETSDDFVYRNENDLLKLA